MTSEVIKGHIKTLLCPYQSNIFVYGPILMKICMNAYIKKTQIFHKCHFYLMEKVCDSFTLKPFDLISTLTYVRMDNFCPCLHIILQYYIGYIIVMILLNFSANFNLPSPCNEKFSLATYIHTLKPWA